jgi:hypothetical protein
VLLRARFEPYAVLAPSIYADDLELRLFDVNSGALLSGPLSVPLRAQVTPQAQANLAGLTRSAEAAIATMDFGVLETGESQRIYLQVRANTTVAVELASENQGVLKLDGAPDAAPIVYNLTFDGERGAGSSWRTSRTPPLTLSGASYPIDVQIGAVEGRFAGRYRDTVTITVVPN